MIEDFEIIDQDFIQTIQKLIGDNFFGHYYLVNAIDRVLNGVSTNYEAYVLTEDPYWMIGFMIDGNYYMYHNGFTENQVNVFLAKNDLTIFQKGFHFAGTKTLIKELMHRTDLKLEIFKDRKYYKCDHVVSFDPNPLHTITQPAEHEIPEVCTMLVDYFEDEYHGKNNKKFDEMLPDVETQVKLGRLRILKVDGKIKSVCSLVEMPTNTILIGSFFTKRDSRNLGYGLSLLKNVTSKLLESKPEVWLIADATNESSLVVFEKAGYRSIYETIDCVVIEQLTQ